MWVSNNRGERKMERVNEGNTLMTHCSNIYKKRQDREDGEDGEML